MNRVTSVVEMSDRIVIHTTQRRASAILQVLAGGSLQEVGDGFGVSRERIRQYMNDAGLTAQNRLRQHPTRRAVELFKRTSRRLARRVEKRHERAAQMVTIVKEVGAEIGGSPSCPMVARRLLGNHIKHAEAQALISYLASYAGHKRTFRRLRAIWRMAGYEMATLGKWDRNRRTP